MRGLQHIIEFIISAILIIVMAAAQMLYCLHSTLMSPQHLSMLLENDERLAELTGIIYKSLEFQGNSDAQSDFLKQYMAKILANTDQAWLKSQVYITAKGIHQYVFSETTVLPTLDIIPLKKTISTVLISDIMRSDQARQRVEKIKTILSALNNKYFAGIVALGLDNQLVSMLFELAPIRSTGFDKAAVNDIIRIYLSLSNQSISLEQASAGIAEQMTADMLKLGEIKDYFDLSFFMDKSFGELDPLKICKNFINSSDKVASTTANVLLWGVLLLLAISKRFQLIKTIKAAARCFLISSISLFSFSALIVNRAIIERLLSYSHAVQGSFSYIAMGYSSLLIHDFGLYLALQAFITVLFCALSLLLASKIKAPDKKEKVIRRIPVIRLYLGVFAFLLIFIVLGSIAFSNEYKTFRNSLKALSEINTSQAVKKGLIEAGGMEFLNIIEKSQ